MNTKPLEKFAQAARRQLHEQVRARLEQVMGTDSPELRARQKAINELNKQIAQSSRQAVVEQVAYTWFNRFCALRYMDANRYTRLGVVSPAAGFTQPEILQEAKAGHIDPDLAPFVDSQRIHDLLSGHIPSPNPQQEAYRLLLVGSCNQYHQAMPFLFEKIDDYSELLMPDDLLSASSILQQMREALTDDTCQDVEVIGWLYQFYISEKKDEVIGAKQAINPGDIPAATQLFTPHWIVRYLVENSLGRLWLQTHPRSRIVDSCQFLVDSGEEVDSGQLIVDSADGSTADHQLSTTNYQLPTPESLRVCDPAVGSGHMLTYAFDLLYAIYEEEGYNPADIPRLILQHNLTGLEIDERAASLAAFALTMKARAKDRRFFRRGVAPNIVTLRPIAFAEAELEAEVEALLTQSFPRMRESTGATGEGMDARPTPSRGQALRGHDKVEGGHDTQLNLSFPRMRESTTPAGQEMDARIRGHDMAEALREDLRHDLALFRQADNVGSLLRPRLSAAQLTQLHDRLSAPAGTGQLSLFNEERRKKARQAIAQAIPLAQLYDVVIANPPYLGNFNEHLKKFAKTHYPDSKSDLFAMFMERNLDLTRPNGLVAMINMQSWMFLSSYEKLREKLLNRYAIASMAHIGARGFDSIGGEVVSTTAFVLENAARPERKGAFVRLVDGRNEAEKAAALREAIQNPDCGYFYRAAAADFKKIPGSPIAYWVSERARELFQTGKPIGEIAAPRKGNTTTNNNRFLRFWPEVNRSKIGIACNDHVELSRNHQKWVPYNKGGGFRKWYGLNEFLVNWANNGEEIKSIPHSVIANGKFFFSPGLTWSTVTSGNFSLRKFGKGFIFDNGGCCVFGEPRTLIELLGYMNSRIFTKLYSEINPTLNFQSGDVAKVPFLELQNETIDDHTLQVTDIARKDWDSYETSWDFTALPLLAARQPGASLAATYAALRQGWQAATLEMQRLEEENNRLFIHAYGLQDELTPQVPLSEITLTCNPHYRYGSGQLSVDSSQLAFFTTNSQLSTINFSPGEAGREIRLLADTMREFISYAVGCMFGRYSLDAPGLILANQGETVEDYAHKLASLSVMPANAGIHKGMDSRIRGNDTVEGMDSRPTPSRGQAIRGNDTVEGAGEQGSGGDTPPLHNSQFTIHNSQFPPDKDNAIPMLDGDWFSDDVTERFKKFLRVTFGEAHYEENLAFIEAALGRDVRGYFLREFYNDHVKMYKKRPIYWLFSSAKGSFNVLIYMHRYRPDTVSIILNDYLREYRAKLTARKSHLEGVSVSASATPRDKTQALKEVTAIQKILQELRDYEDDILYPLATQQLQIDLDDGVLVNYNKFGRALKKVVGLSW